MGEMPLERLFTFGNAFVLPFWALLIAAPRWRWTRRLVHGPLAPVVLCGVYVYMLLASLPAPEGSGFFSLYQVMILFTEPRAVMAGWVHYLVFDLFVGAWAARDAQRVGVPHLLLVPCLLATLLVGPVGLLLYLAVRAAITRRLGLSDAA